MWAPVAFAAWAGLQCTRVSVAPATRITVNAQLECLHVYACDCCPCDNNPVSRLQDDSHIAFHCGVLTLCLAAMFAASDEFYVIQNSFKTHDICRSCKQVLLIVMKVSGCSLSGDNVARGAGT